MSKQELIQLIDELHKPLRKNFKRRCVSIRGFDDLWQIDLVEMIPYANINNDNKYILTVIDTFSKYAWAVPLKSKKCSTVTKAFENIINQGRIPKNLQSDQGNEFYGKEFQYMVKLRGINHYSTFSELKVKFKLLYLNFIVPYSFFILLFQASIVERFNRTLKNKMYKRFSLQMSYKWENLLQELVNDYNHTVHSKIKRRPVDVSKENEKIILNSIYKPTFQKKFKSKFKVDDYVRIGKYKKIFEKGYTPNYSAEVFMIEKIVPTFPITYILKDYQGNILKGGFYKEEIIKTNCPDVFLVEKVIKKKNNKEFVKWYGFDDSHNSWIDIKDVVNN